MRSEAVNCGFQVKWRNGAMMDGNTLRHLLPPPDVGTQGGHSVYKRMR